MPTFSRKHGTSERFGGIPPEPENADVTVRYTQRANVRETRFELLTATNPTSFALLTGTNPSAVGTNPSARVSKYQAQALRRGEKGGFSKKRSFF